ncbi:MAG TPA: bifunctional [glutamine synthetase] adenylyltransferase/[glutamine synthetase]-adenylyl-L-tyrosine phosphorylase, partial [Rhodospirillales bacterium]|nr:bifunctional [glutamine synthetase] adenylyltransferase/[glutamine synthetase]-adenylyl-L-tyrosine phosphorylase [Rhodospirillales bacterium]
DLQLADPDNPETGSGLVILGMGKLGGCELNYSSDVDLIVLFDPDAITTKDPDNLQTAFVRLTRNLVQLLEDKAVDGYVFRTDLRLRPDPAATPMAISVLAAETYYESIGQNWERAAMIKARPVAGDMAAGAAFLKWLTPFIWRKNLDFAAIQDIHSIKRQINAQRGGSGISAAGHNVKLGRGGIREIEFFAQTQQLIWGGRLAELRLTRTEETLAELFACGQISKNVRDDMIAAYRYLRRVEHRLQMIDDKQTHSLPEDAEQLRQIAIFLGYHDSAALSDELIIHLTNVETHYAGLFEDAPSLGAASSGGEDALGNLVFTGGDSDPDTLRTIESLGFQNATMVDATVRGWHHGRYRAMRSARARELLTEFFPVLLKALAATPDPDATFNRFDEFLSGLPAGVQLFSMFYSNPGLLDLVAEIMGGAPRLAQYLARRPQVLESVLAPGFFSKPPTKKAMENELAQKLKLANHIEDVLILTRRWTNDRRFQVGVQSLSGRIVPRLAAHTLSDIAQVAISQLYIRVEQEFANSHGRIAGSDMSVVSLGKLGSREMTAESDLDLVFIYDLADGAEASDGDKPLPPSQYFARLSQRLINAISVQTAEGSLYEVDMRLRPSGATGPIASSLQSFIHYHQSESWTWEHMALTRARVICGSAVLSEKIDQAIFETLIRQRDPAQLLADVVHMRDRIDAEHHTDFIWDVKHLRGGLVDVEFIAQYLLLRHAHKHTDMLATDTRTMLLNIKDLKLIDDSLAWSLIEALDFWQSLQAMLRLTIPRAMRKNRDHSIPQGLQGKLAKAGGASDFKTLVAKVDSTAATVLAHYQTLITDPAGKISPPARQ